MKRTKWVDVWIVPMFENRPAGAIEMTGKLPVVAGSEKEAKDIADAFLEDEPEFAGKPWREGRTVVVWRKQ